MNGISTEIQSSGGGYGGYGLGSGGGYNPLLWLITLGFLKGGNGFLGGENGGAVASAGLAKANEGIACLSDGQNNIIQQQQFDRLATTMSATGDRTVSVIGDLTNDFNSFSRDLNMALCNGFNQTQVQNLQSNFQISKQIADCCCDTRAGQKEIENAICHQTNTLLTAGSNNTQRIVDLITSNRISDLETQLNDCKTSKTVIEQTAAIIATINAQCRPQCCPLQHAPVPAPAG